MNSRDVTILLLRRPPQFLGRRGVGRFHISDGGIIGGGGIALREAAIAIDRLDTRGRLCLGHLVQFGEDELRETSQHELRGLKLKCEIEGVDDGMTKGCSQGASVEVHGTCSGAIGEGGSLRLGCRSKAIDKLSLKPQSPSPEKKREGRQDEDKKTMDNSLEMWRRDGMHAVFKQLSHPLL